MGSKWVELIREIAPSVQTVAMLFNPATANAGASGGVYLQSMKAAASALGLELTVSPVSHPSEIDAAFAAVAEHGSRRSHRYAQRLHCCEPGTYRRAGGAVSRSDCLSALAFCRCWWPDFVRHRLH